jgi:DNA-binding response OmpR family regulator
MRVVLNTRTRPQLPITVLSARTLESRGIAVVEAAVGEYVTKLVSTPELPARMRTLLHSNVQNIIGSRHD